MLAFGVPTALPAADWFECSMAGVIGNLTNGSPGFQGRATDRGRPEVIFAIWNTRDNPVPENERLHAGQWYYIDVTDRVPPGTRCIALKVLKAITYGTTSNQSCDLYLHFRRDVSQGGSGNTDYTIARDKSGARENGTIVVPLEQIGTQLRFMFAATIINPIPPQLSGYYGTIWPTGCSFGVAAYINWYGY